MAEKKLTPIQEAIANIELTMITGNFSPQEIAVMTLIQKNLLLIIPKEKEFSKSIWNAASDCIVLKGSVDVSKNFNSYYQQYEP